MDRVIVNFRPFVIGQTILTYVNDECVEQLNVPIEQISATVNGLCNKYDIHKVDLIGDESYISQFAAELNMNFNNVDREINIVSR